MFSELPLIVLVPYQVLIELDKEISKTWYPKNVYAEAVAAVNAINGKFKNERKLFYSQGKAQHLIQLIRIRCPDERIINFCLQVQNYIEKKVNVKAILLTDDKILKNKAAGSNIPSMSNSFAETSLQQIFETHASK